MTGRKASPCRCVEAVGGDGARQGFCAFCLASMGRQTTWRRTQVRPLGHLHRPRLYRYRPADTRPRFLLNRYPFSVIGAGVVLRGWCWCVKWADA